MEQLIDFYHALRDLLSFRLFSIKGQGFSIFDLIVVLLILFSAKILVRFLGAVVLNRLLNKNEVDQGRQFAIVQLISYFIYFFALLIAFDTIGFDITIFLAGSAALLVGVGLGLQQTFNDLISGLILLFEGSVKVGDVVQVDDMIGKVNTIGMRTSHIETRDKIMIVVPNSKITVNNVINWSYTGAVSRFTLRVGVAYGSDVELVRRTLIQAAEEHPKVIESPPSVVRFADFGESSLDFELYFSSADILGIKDTLSDLRFSIDKKFRTRKIEIPYPQRDINFRNSISIDRSEQGPAPADSY